jgi:hypothetical protein
MSLYKYKDVRKTLVRDSKRGPILRPVSGITHLVIHHSAVRRSQAGANAEGYARFHVQTRGWRHIAYTWVIEQDGTTKRCLSNTEQGAHVGIANPYSLGICLTGDFTKEKPTAEQERALRALVPFVRKEVPSIKYIRGHREMPGASTTCPAFDYKKVLAASAPAPAPSTDNFIRVQLNGKQLHAFKEKASLVSWIEKNAKAGDTVNIKR